MNGEPRGSEGFQEPPADVGRGAGPAHIDEEAAEQFAVPGEGAAEVAAVSEPPDALAGVGMELLEIKRAIEERMRQYGRSTLSAMRATFRALPLAWAMGLGSVPLPSLVPQHSLYT